MGTDGGDSPSGCAAPEHAVSGRNATPAGCELIPPRDGKALRAPGGVSRIVMVRRGTAYRACSTA